tara:strand:- start:422 stop:1141 length:720 start_codon:yes stop_codon:yes gene_type:complete
MTLDEIAYNIKNIVEGGRHGEDSSISIKQIRHMVNYHRARLMTKWTEGGRYFAETFVSKYRGTIISNANSTSYGAATMPQYLSFNGNKGLIDVSVYSNDEEPSSHQNDAKRIPFYERRDYEFMKTSKFFQPQKLHAVYSESSTSALSNRLRFYQDGELYSGGGYCLVAYIAANPTNQTTEYPMPEELIPELIKAVTSIEFGVMLNVGEDLTNNSVDDKFATKKSPQAKMPRKQRAQKTR